MNDNTTSNRSLVALWAAVILQAALDATGRESQQLTYHDKINARRWFNLRNEDFVNVCAMGGWNPEYVYERSITYFKNPRSWRAAPGFGPRFIERQLYRKRRAARQSPHSSTRTPGSAVA